MGLMACGVERGAFIPINSNYEYRALVGSLQDGHFDPTWAAGGKNEHF